MRKSNNVWNPWILIPAGVIVALVGLIIWLQTASRKKRFIGETTAEILSVKRSSHHSNGMTRHVYTPTVAYTVDGNRYEVKGQGSGKSDYYTQGARIAIFYNPGKPEKCLTIPFKDSKRGANITMLIGAGLIVLGAIALLVRKKTKIAASGRTVMKKWIGFNKLYCTTAWFGCTSSAVAVFISGGGTVQLRRSCCTQKMEYAIG